MRRRLQAWLTLRGLNEDERADIVLAVSEACNNAVEHAYERNEGTINVVVSPVVFVNWSEVTGSLLH